MKSQGLVLFAVVVVLGLCRPALAYRVLDPALGSEDPSAFRDDAWDRAAASRVDRARGTNLRALLTNPSADREVVDTLRTTTAGKGETFQGRFAARAPEVLLIRRARAAYAAAASAMRSEDANSRAWGLRTFEFVESRGRGGPSSQESGPPYEGQERDAALTAAAYVVTNDPSADLRAEAVFMMHQHLPDHDEPSPEALAAALARERDENHRYWVLQLMAVRKAPACLLLDSVVRGFRDPTDVAVGIEDVFVEANRGLLEATLARGNAACRAGIGEAFYRHQTPMPWARALILKGLADPVSAVRVRFAKGALVLRPFDADVCARLEALADEAYTARWALAINAGREPEPPPDDEAAYNPIPEASSR